MEKIKIKDVESVLSENAIVLDKRPPVAPPSGYALTILLALQEKHIYSGTVAPAEKARRRAANKVARKSRRANR